MNTGGLDSTVLVVTVDELRIGLPIERVGEVVRMVSVTELPGAPDVVLGVVDLRGEVTPVIDLRRRLGRPGRRPQLDDRLVSVVLDTGVVLVRVDETRGLQTVDPADAAPLAGPLAADRHLSGVTRTAGGLLYLHEADAFLSDRDMADLDAALAAVAGADVSRIEQ